MTSKTIVTTAPEGAVEAPARRKPRISRVERARRALEVAEAKESERRAVKAQAALARRVATMAMLSKNHDKLASIDNELVQLVGHDAYLAFDLPGPVCDRWTDESSYTILASGRMVTLAELKSFYDEEHDKPVLVEYAGSIYSYPTKDAYEKAVQDGEPEAIYGAEVAAENAAGTVTTPA
ncbi:hypothetical protein C8K30_1011048 [Promicromonospora sp. AC04]|uniref:hypothetical protein n=1 Tax=Promicromonospora sp. AC04 TaxID=2135723 RepID=UPI000D4C499B|nr:hypothetical protein [Promicromonospora sp. AC04]PUB32522.1 hypothetical protein C8K30_1011048 [Promicromonospora sp. AC04]